MSYHVDVIPNRNSPPCILFEGFFVKVAGLMDLI